jgi:hemolysin activation/secretion protein
MNLFLSLLGKRDNTSKQWMFSNPFSLPNIPQATLCLALFAANTAALGASQDGLSPKKPEPSLLEPSKQGSQDGISPSFGKKSPHVPTGQTKRVKISSITISGNKEYSSDELLAVLTDKETGKLPLGRLTFDEIQALADKITEFYRQNGYVVSQAVLPEQDVSNGHLTIKVVEGHVDSVRFGKTPNPDTDYKSVFEQNFKPESGPIKKEDLNRALKLSAEATGTHMTANIEAGTKPGGSDLVVDATALPRFFYGFGADNFGTKSLGVYRGTVFTGGNSWLVDGDRTRFEFATTNEFDRSRRYDLSYALPLNATGWSGGVRTWYTDYNLGGAFAASKTNGTARAAEISANYALQRATYGKSDFLTGYTYVALANQSLEQSNDQRHVHTIWSTLAGQYDSTFLTKNTRNNYSATATVGILEFDNAIQAASDKTGLKTNGTYALINLSDNHEQILVDTWSLYGSVRGQLASKNLDSYHKMSLGGSTAVRAYASGESSGDHAVIGTAELRYLYAFEVFGSPTSAHLSGFYDLGWSQINANPIASTTATSNTATRGGYGIELNLYWAETIGLQLFWAHIDNSYRQSDIDGKRSRLGVNLSGAF